MDRVALVLVALTFASQSLLAQSALRLRVERYVASHYPGFRLARRDDYVKEDQRFIREGASGPLLTGRFNYDTVQDFAAILIGGRTNDSNERETKHIVCFGSRSGSYRCDETTLAVSLPLEGPPFVARAGRHYCRGADGDTTLKTTIDSLGEIIPEKSSYFWVVRRDGTREQCVQSD